MFENPCSASFIDIRDVKAFVQQAVRANASKQHISNVFAIRGPVNLLDALVLGTYFPNPRSVDVLQSKAGVTRLVVLVIQPDSDPLPIRRPRGYVQETEGADPSFNRDTGNRRQAGGVTVDLIHDIEPLFPTA